MRKSLPLVGVLILVAAIAVAATLVLTGGDDGDGGGKAAARTTPATGPLAGGETLVVDGAFSLQYPKSWQKVDTAKAEGDQESLATIRRGDRSGQMTVQRGGKLDQSFDEIADELTTRLKKQVKGFRRLRGGEVELPGGTALSYTFVRADTGQVQNLVVLPRGEKTYTITTVFAGGSEATAREVAAIVRSFLPEDA